MKTSKIIGYVHRHPQYEPQGDFNIHPLRPGDKKDGWVEHPVYDEPLDSRGGFHLMVKDIKDTLKEARRALSVQPHPVSPEAARYKASVILKLDETLKRMN